MAVICPNFNFNGQCEAAVVLYQEAFGAKLKSLMRYSDANPKDLDRPLPAGQEKRVFHAELTIGEQRMTMCDTIEGDEPAYHGTALSLLVTLESAQAVRRAFVALSQGGKIYAPLQTTTYSKCFGSVIDPYGVRWVLMTS